MLPISLIHHWAAVMPDYQATAAVLWVAVAVTAVCGVLRRRAAVRAWLPATLFVAGCAAAMWPLSRPGTAWWLLGTALGFAVCMLALHVLGQGAGEEPAGSPRESKRPSLVYFGVAVFVATLILLHNLAGYSGTALVAWETTVIPGFGEAFLAGQSIWHFLLQRFLWDDGILSAGNTSLFYGAPTYALFHLIGFSTWTLRIAAVAATLLSLLVAYALARHFFGAFTAAAVALLLALNPAVLYYGHYGSSPAGTMLAVLLAVFSTWLFVERERSAWWRAVLCGVLLYLATLQYSPGRIVVLILLGFIPVALVYQWRQVGWRRALGVVIIAALAVGVWQLESHFHRQTLFLQARGEQFFDLLQSPDYINSLYGRALVPPNIRPGQLTTADKIQLLGRALLLTGPQYLRLMSPVLSPQAQGTIISADPPPLQLYYAPVGLFILWGLAYSLRRWRSWPHVCLLLWVGAGTVPLLLTNRVDAHRIMLFVVPLSFWAAFGVSSAARALRAAAVPRILQHAIAVALSLTAAYSAINLLYYEQIPQPPAGRAIVAELPTIPGRVIVGAEGWQREVAWGYVQMMERTRQNRNRAGRLLEERLVHGVQPERGPIPEAVVRELHRLTAEATLLLLPANNFRGAGAALEQKGARVTERGLPEFHLLRVDGGVEASAVPNEDIAALPTPEIKPTPTPPKPIVLRGGLKQWITELEPLETTYGFEPPRVDHTWEGAPLRMGGITYEHGIGAHAWCRMTYPVPANAIAFQAIVGLSDGVKECERAAVTFEVHDDKDRLLFDSGLIDNSAPPMPVEVDLHNTKTVTLVVTEGDNGPNCDHADWALAAYLLKPK